MLASLRERALRVHREQLPRAPHLFVRPGSNDDEGDAAGVPHDLLAGTSCLADLLAPDALEQARDHIHLDGRYTRTLALTGYPRSVVFGWLDALTAANETLDLSLHLQPQDARAAMRLLSHKMVQLHSSRLAGARAGRLDDPEREVAYADCERLRDRLQRGDERVLSASLYVTVHAASLDELEARTARVETLIGTALGQSRRTTWRSLDGLHSTLPAGRDALGIRRTLDTSSLATMFPFSCADLFMTGGVLYGLNTQTNALVVVNAFSPDLPNANCCIVGISGAGKSYGVKQEVSRVLCQGVRVVVIDPENEYARLAAALEGQVVHLSAGSPHRLNPLDLPPVLSGGLGAMTSAAETVDDANEAGSRPAGHDALAEHLAGLHGLCDIMLAGEGQRLTQHEKGVLDRALVACYAIRGITADPATHVRPAPTLLDLRDTLRQMGETCGLADRLERYCAGSLSGLFSGPTTVSLDRRLVVFCLRDLDEELRPAAMYLVAQHVWGRATRAQRSPLRLVVDEAHILTRHPSGDRFLENLARRARKYFLGVTAISQDVRDFLATGAGRALLANSALRLLLRQDASTLAALEESLQLTAAERAYLVSCPRGEGLLCVQGQRIPLRMEASPQEHLLCTTDPREAGRGAPAA